MTVPTAELRTRFQALSHHVIIHLLPPTVPFSPFFPLFPFLSAIYAVFPLSMPFFSVSLHFFRFFPLYILQTTVPTRFRAISRHDIHQPDPICIMQCRWASVHVLAADVQRVFCEHWSSFARTGSVGLPSYQII